MVLSAALYPCIRKLSFLSESQQAKLLDILMQLESTDNASSTDAGKVVEPPLKKRSVLDRLFGDNNQEEDACILDEVKS